jgi:hypothetical protein
MASKSHEDVEYMVERGIDRGHGQRATDPTYYKDSKEALAAAAQAAISTGASTLSVLIHSKAGARFYGGDDAVEAYLEDPDASAHEQYEFTVNAVGRVP